jgi:cytochrome c-type biogenesis protein CcmF
MMIFADIELERDGARIGSLHPAKFIYKRMPESPTTEVSLRRSFGEDLYVIVGNIDAETKRATFQVHLNPLVSWIWIGLLVLMVGTTVSLWPEGSFGEVGAWSYVRAAAATAAMVALGLVVAAAPARAYASGAAARASPAGAYSAK